MTQVIILDEQDNQLTAYNTEVFPYRTGDTITIFNELDIHTTYSIVSIHHILRVEKHIIPKDPNFNRMMQGTTIRVKKIDNQE